MEENQVKTYEDVDYKLEEAGRWMPFVNYYNQLMFLMNPLEVKATNPVIYHKPGDIDFYYDTGAGLVLYYAYIYPKVKLGLTHNEKVLLVEQVGDDIYNIIPSNITRQTKAIIKRERWKDYGVKPKGFVHSKELESLTREPKK